MKFFFKRLRKNNRGSSLVVTIVAISFVAILGAVIMSATMANYRMKMMNYNSKKTFYSAEKALEEVSSGVSQKCFDELNTAYLETVTNLVNISDESRLSGSMANDLANARMKAGYNKKLVDLLTTMNGVDPFPDSADRTNLKNSLEQFISQRRPAVPGTGDTKYAYVKSVGTLKAYKADGSETTQTDYTGIDEIRLNDVTVVFESTTDDYYTSVTVDMKLGYPDVRFNFIDDRNHLNTYLDYAVIGMKGVSSGAGTVSILKSGVYAGIDGMGNGGFNVGTNSILNLSDSSMLVTCGNVNVDTGATFNVDRSKLWAVNLNLKGNNAGGTSYALSSNDTSVIYLADDLNLAGISNNVILDGSFYGFGFAGSPRVSGSKYDYNSMSSAVVINGSKGDLNMENLNRLLLAGRAYIKVGDGGVDSGYMTGDSVGLKQIQEIYLVPTAYINPDCTNPMPVTGSSVTEPGHVVTLTSLKSNRLFDGLLNDTSPVIAINNNDDGVTNVYYYLNFKNDATRLEYVSRLRNDAYRDCDGWDELNRITNKALENLYGSSIPSDASITSTIGNMYAVSGDNITINKGNASLDITAICRDKANRYKVLDQFLYDVGDDAIEDGKAGLSVNDGSVVSIPHLNADGTNGADEPHIIDDSRTVYEYVIDMSKWDKVTDGSLFSDAGVTLTDGYYINKNVPAPGDCGYAVLVPDDASAFDLNSHGITKGVVLANNRNIIVNTNFEGLIITNGSVMLQGGSTVQANRMVSENTIKYDKILSQFFIAYQGADLSGLTAADVSNEDLLDYDNWRKNYE